MKRILALMAISMGLLFAESGIASEIHVMSGGAPKEVFSVLVPRFEQQTGKKIKLEYAVITVLRQKIATGEQADVFVPVPALDGLEKEGKVQNEGRRTFGTVGVSVIVKEGGPGTGHFERTEIQGCDAGCAFDCACYARSNPEW
jgi:ABC-type molybdate transport system substrate-binding protein